MPLRRLLALRLLRRRRAEADQVWRESTRGQSDVDRILTEAHRSQAEASAEAFERIFRQARSLP